MKIRFLCLVLAAVAVPAVADETSSLSTQPSTATPATGSTAPEGQGQRMERLKAALAQLDLTDAQKEQIKQIRGSVTDRKERRQQIMAVLTPDQKAKLVAMWQAHKNGTGAVSNGNDDP
jgi:Spy/CpxP family protein refolding chaperone